MQAVCDILDGRDDAKRMPEVDLLSVRPGSGKPKCAGFYVDCAGCLYEGAALCTCMLNVTASYACECAPLRGEACRGHTTSLPPRLLRGTSCTALHVSLALAAASAPPVVAQYLLWRSTCIFHGTIE